MADRLMADRKCHYPNGVDPNGYDEWVARDGTRIPFPRDYDPNTDPVPIEKMFGPWTKVVD